MWRPFLVLILGLVTDTILIGLSSGAPSRESNLLDVPDISGFPAAATVQESATGSTSGSGPKARNQERTVNSNEIPVVAQEQTLSATGSTSDIESMPPGSKARNGAQSDHLAQLLSSRGGKPGGIQTSASLLKAPTSTSDRIPHIRAAAASPESMPPGSKARNGAQSDLSQFLSSVGSKLHTLAISLPRGIPALARLLNPPKTTTSTIAQVLNGQARAEEEPEDIITDEPMNCRYKTSNLDAHALGVCPAGCYTWPLKGQCWCPRNAKDDCETEMQCHWSVDAQTEGKCKHASERLYGLASLLDPPNTTTTSDRIAQNFNGGSEWSKARNGAQSDLHAQLLNSLESKPGGIQALATLLNPPNVTMSTSDRIAQDLNGGARMEEEPVESCRFKTSNADALTDCAAHCATLFPAIKGRCLCPRNTKDDCESKKGCSWSVVAQAEGICTNQMEALYNALYKKLDKRGNTADLTEDSFNFAYSIAVSPVAAAGVSTTGEIGVAFGSNGEILVFAGRCLGLKADVSVELDIMLGFWNSIDDVLGPIYQLGIGADTTELKNEKGNDETGAHVEQIYNSDGGAIGFAISLGYGYGVDLPVDFEINFDKCHNYELWRFHWKDLYNMIWV